MKKSNLIYCIILGLTLASCSKGGAANPYRPDIVEYSLVQVDPLVKIMKEDRTVEEYVEAADVARGETVSFQLVFKSNVPVKDLMIEPGKLTCGSYEISHGIKAFERYIRGGLHLTPAGDDAILPASDEYPDCLDETELTAVASNYKQPVWVTYKIPEDAPAGDYTAEIVVSGMDAGSLFRTTVVVKAKVYDVDLPEKQSLLVTNWHVHSKIGMIGTGGNVPVFSDRYYQLMGKMANVMRDHGQNVYYINPLTDFIVCSKDGSGIYRFDFTNFDRTVEMFLQEGGLARIEGGHLAFRSGDWNSDYWVKVPGYGNKPIEAPEAKSFLSQFIPALKAHLQDKGWWDIYMQHIGDEPAQGAVPSYIKIAQYVKSLAPDIVILDAVHSRELNGTVDVWCPQLDYFHTDYSFYKERQADGDQMWFYTCMAPRGNYANRFLENPLIKVRLLHWINFRYGATGYLHWGFNQVWENALTNVATEGYCPAGDMFIAYPGRNKVHSSIRLETMRDGICDYELLNLLASKNSEKAMEIARSIVLNFNVYNTDPDVFREARRTLLKALEQY